METQLNKTALITGCGRKRVGYVVAKRLLQIGYKIAVHYHSSESSAAENVEEFRQLGGEAEKFQANVADEGQVKKLVQDTVQRFGSLDVLVTTSSIWKTIPLTEVTAEDVLASFQVNTLGTFLCCQHAGHQMVSQSEGGAIVTIGDSLIDHPYVDHAAYFTAKGSIPTLTRAFAVELGTRNPQVRVNCIAPGPVMFPSDLPANERKAATASTLTKCADHPEAVAATVAFLVGNPMLSGCCIPVDSGRNIYHEQLWRSGASNG